jgi:hypothetical protein|tara:strand:- start:437 stop:820 length:384 start_codon:yes stop_codon:yes gene_type:complete
MIYVCSVYSQLAKGYSPEAKTLRQQRFEYVGDRIAGWMNDGLKVYSPICHCHELANRNSLPKDYTFWQEFDRHMIDVAEEVFVLKMPLWEDSTGITDEVKYAKSTGKKVTYFEVDDYEEDPALWVTV